MPRFRRLLRRMLATLIGAAGLVRADPAPVTDPCTGTAASQGDPPAHRLYLVRHGEANYVGADGKPVPDPNLAGLSERGRQQARAAAHWFCTQGIRRFDVVVTSPYTRAQQTTAELLTTMHLAPGIARTVAALHEQDPDHETLAEARARILPAVEQLRGERWNTALVVAHSQVDRIILSELLVGSDALIAHLEQGNGCINVIDLGDGARPTVLRALNVCPPEGGLRY